VTFLEHFGFIEQPFGVTPDPRFLHLGSQHREALASLVHATEEKRGFVALIGPPGMGKTTLLFQYLEGLRHRARTAFLFQNARDTSDLMRYLLADLGMGTSSKDLPELNGMLNGVLAEEMRAGRPFVLVIDEAQNLGAEVLESIRLLSNFETPWVKLMQIVLAGQPQLAERLSQPSMAQLRQRISSFVRLVPFTAEETNAYIEHRLWVAGHPGPNPFTVGARTLIAEHSGGIPRSISNLCYQSLVLAHAAGKGQVKAEMVREAISDRAIEWLLPGNGNGTPCGSTTPLVSAPGASSSAKLTLLPGPRGRSNADSRRASLAVVSIFAMLFLSIVSGALWKANLTPKPLGVTPNVEATTFPVLSTALAPAPETMSPISNNRANAKTERSGRPPAGVTTAEAASKEPVFTVVVARDTTLRHISLEYLGHFDAADLAAILSLNPKITNPDEIETGQEISLPLSLRRDSAINAKDAGDFSPTSATEGAR